MTDDQMMNGDQGAPEQEQEMNPSEGTGADTGSEGGAEEGNEGGETEGGA